MTYTVRVLCKECGRTYTYQSDGMSRRCPHCAIRELAQEAQDMGLYEEPLTAEKGEAT